MLVIAARMVCNSVGGVAEAGGGVFSFVWLIALAISVSATS